MWAIFILSAICFSFITLLLLYIANKIILKMKEDNLKFEKEKEEKNQ